MQAEQALRALLMQDSAVTTLVGARCYPVELPQDTALPALVTRVISTQLAIKPVQASALRGTHTSRVSVVVLAADYPALQALIPLIRRAAHGFSGLVAGVSVGRISAELIGPAFRDSDLRHYSQSLDFLVTVYQQESP